MKDSSGLAGAFCLLRLLPLLDAVASPLGPSVGAVADALVAGRDVADDVLIALDDYRQAALGEPGESFTPIDLQKFSCTIALRAAGAEVDGGAPDDAVLRSLVMTLWHDFYRNFVEPPKRSLDPARLDSDLDSFWAAYADRAGLPREGEELAGSDLGLDDVWSSFAEFVAGEGDAVESEVAVLTESEATWQRLDEQVIAASASDPTAVPRHLEALRARFPEERALLADRVAALEWSTTSAGPCGRDCDWPMCASGSPACVRRRSFQPQQTVAASLRRKRGEPARPWYARIIRRSEGTDANGGPRTYLIEFDADGYERRKIAEYTGLHREWAMAGRSSGVMKLAQNRVASIHDLLCPEVVVEEIDETVFAYFWKLSTGEQEGCERKAN